MADVFISYHEASAGKLVEQIAAALESDGISCWYAKRDTPPGGDFARYIPLQINACKVFLLILSSGVCESRHVQNEVGIAFSRLNKSENITILPFQADNVKLDSWAIYYLVHTQIVKSSVEDLTQKVAEILGKAPVKQEEPEPTTPDVAPTPPKANPTKKSGNFSIIMWILIFLTEVLVLSFLLIMPFLRPTVSPSQNLSAQELPEQYLWKFDGSTTLIISRNIDYYPDTTTPPWYNLNETITEVVIESWVTNIEPYAFANFIKLEKVTIPDTVTKIEYSAFSDCRSLTSIKIPDSVTTLGSYVFCNCGNLQKVVLSNCLTCISAYAFRDCAFQSITIPDSVVEIQNYAFFACANLSDVYIPLDSEKFL